MAASRHVLIISMPTQPTASAILVNLHVKNAPISTSVLHVSLVIVFTPLTVPVWTNVLPLTSL